MVPGWYKSRLGLEVEIEGCIRGSILGGGGGGVNEGGGGVVRVGLGLL